MDPRGFEVHETLRNGTPVRIRAIRPDDRERLSKAYGRLAPEAIYLRTFGYRKGLTGTELRRLTEVDFDREVALVVITESGTDETVVGGGRYVRADDGAAEIAFTVDGEFRNQGIAGRLLAHLAGIARARGLQQLKAHVLPDNLPMLSVFARSGLPMDQRRDGGVVHVALTL